MDIYSLFVVVRPRKLQTQILTGGILRIAERLVPVHQSTKTGEQ